jgi:hypothetical protein
MSAEQSILKKIYDAFNARDIDAVLATLHPDVDWPNGWEGGRVHGHDAVRDYWTRQFAAIDPHVEPTAFHTGESGRTIVDVHTVVHDRDGKLLADRMVRHNYLFEDGLIRHMEIEEP